MGPHLTYARQCGSFELWRCTFPFIPTSISTYAGPPLVQSQVRNESESKGTVHLVLLIKKNCIHYVVIFPIMKASIAAALREPVDCIASAHFSQSIVLPFEFIGIDFLCTIHATRRSNMFACLINFPTS